MRFTPWLLLLAACGGPAVSADASSDVTAATDGGELDAPTCGWTSSRDVAQVSDPRLTEMSGMAASHRDPGVLYVHNDSGESVARFFALGPDGAVLAEMVIDGAPSFDIEDAALEHESGREWIYLGDVGDNAARDGGTPRAFIEVSRAEIPALPASAAETVHIASHERFRFTYPDAPHDCEALILDPLTHDLYLLSKVNSGAHTVYRAAAPHIDGSDRVLERVADLLPGRSLADAITAADVDDTGRFLVRTYRRIYLFGNATETTPVARWSVTPLELPTVPEFQGEAVAFSSDARTVFTVAEGEGENIHALDDGCAP